jgi:hypothetical protein
VAQARRGWVAPVELPDEGGQAGALVVPLDANGGLHPRYRLGYAKYLGKGSYQSYSSVLDRQQPGDLEWSIGGRTVCFRLRLVGGQPVVFDYVGQFLHPDFHSRLAEIEPESERQLDELFDEESVVVVGCDPATPYPGAGATA